MNVRCDFVTLDGQEKGHTTVHIPTIFGFNLCGLHNEIDIARKVEVQIYHETNKLVHINKVIKL
jgi:hypothetical protein